MDERVFIRICLLSQKDTETCSAFVLVEEVRRSVGTKRERVERNEFHGIAFLGSFVFRRTANAHSDFAVTHK